jgi:Kinesin motor domain
MRNQTQQLGELLTAAAEVLGLMHRGAENRRVAATQLNDQSSRSHSIFTATVQVPSCTNDHACAALVAETKAKASHSRKDLSRRLTPPPIAA